MIFAQMYPYTLTGKYTQPQPVTPGQIKLPTKCVVKGQPQKAVPPMEAKMKMRVK